MLQQHLAERWAWLQETKKRLLSYEYELAKFMRESEDTEKLPILPDPQSDTTKITRRL